MNKNNNQAQLVKKGNKLTLNNQINDEHLRPFCEQSEQAVKHKQRADEERPYAAEDIRQALDSNPETKDFTGTVVYIIGSKIYKIRVQRKSSCNWREKMLDDPKLKEYKDLMRENDKMQAAAKKLEAELAEAHPKCITRDFVIAYMK